MEYHSTVYTKHKLEINILKCRNIFTRVNYMLCGFIERVGDVVYKHVSAGSIMFVTFRWRIFVDRCLQRQFQRFVSVYDEHVNYL